MPWLTTATQWFGGYRSATTVVCRVTQTGSVQVSVVQSRDTSRVLVPIDTDHDRTLAQAASVVHLPTAETIVALSENETWGKSS